MTSATLTGQTDEKIEVKKRGRPTKPTQYFDVVEEEAVKRFILETSWEGRNEIYNTYLRKPLDKMISSIIRRYRLYRQDMSFTEIHNDTHSFLMTKVEKFKPDKNKKAYSYFGTICKNYLMGQIIKDQKELNRKISYEDISSSLEEDERYSYTIDEQYIDSSLIIEKFIAVVEEHIENGKMNENEVKLGYALIDMFKNYDNIFIQSKNNKFNKNLVLLSIREMTNLNTKEIRSSIKKYKKMYSKILADMIKH
jgi:hypothetical protein